jgi:hypothetical protein
MRTIAALLSLAVAPLAARADEGMWTFDGFPKAQVEKQFGVKVTDAWLDHVRLSSVRLAQGCSGSFVSPDGLVMTNHHCVETCLDQLSTAERNLITRGFYARTAAEEARCPVLEVNQLVRIADVTERMQKATAGLEGQRFKDAQKAETSRIENECQTSPALRCNVVSLWHGGRYDLYEYRRYQDVRVVFAPEFTIAFFGGDPDNFMFPRYDLDASFVRVYEDGKPLRTKDYLRWSKAGPKADDLVFVSGNPGTTDRQLTVAELEYQRDVAIPESIARYSEIRGGLVEFQNRGPEQKRISQSLLFSIENSLKVLKGERAALVDRAFFAKKVAAEDAFRRKLAADPKGAAALQAFAAIQGAEDLHRSVRFEVAYVMGSAGFSTEYFAFARTLLRGAEERPKANEVRLEEFQEAKLPAVTQRLFSPAPIYDEFEVFKLTGSLTRMREMLGPDHPFVRKVLGPESPAELAKRLVGGTKLRDVALRRKLWEGGKAAVDASDDPMIAFARLVDPDSRAVRRTYEDEIESVNKKAAETIAAARFAVEGTSSYPDATFTLRLSYGTVKGWREGRKEIPPFTTIGGAFERHTGRDPFALPRSWLEAKPRLRLDTPFNFVANTDIVGGNSGSPVVGKDGEVVGLVFDGNIWSLGGSYGFDEALNRTVAVDVAAITEALSKVYGAERLLQELEAGARVPLATR